MRRPGLSLFVCAWLGCSTNSNQTGSDLGLDLSVSDALDDGATADAAVDEGPAGCDPGTLFLPCSQPATTWYNTVYDSTGVCHNCPDGTCCRTGACYPSSSGFYVCDPGIAGGVSCVPVGRFATCPQATACTENGCCPTGQTCKVCTTSLTPVGQWTPMSTQGQPMQAT